MSIDGDAIVFNGTSYQIDNLEVLIEEGEKTVFGENGADIDFGLRAVRVVDGDTTAAVGTVLPGTANLPDVASSPFDPDNLGNVLVVPILENDPAGQATFRGEYAGFFVSRPVGQPERAPNDLVKWTVFGDAVIDVSFAEVLSDGTFSGVIENRDYGYVGDGTPAPDQLLNDIVIENGRFDDTGQMTADVSGGEWRFPVVFGYNDEAYQTSPGTMIGQLGGDGGTVIAGSLEIEHQRYLFIDGPTSVPTDDLTWRRLEIGAIVARRD